VRSLVYGGVEKLPIARYSPVAARFPTLIELGIIDSDSRSDGSAVRLVVRVAELETTEPSLFVRTAVIVLAPAPRSLARPVGPTEPIVGALEVHLICGELVTSCCKPVEPEVAKAMNWACWFRTVSA